MSVTRPNRGGRWKENPEGDPRMPEADFHSLIWLRYMRISPGGELHRAACPLQ